MEVEKLGEIVIDGRILNLDDITVSTCEDELAKIKTQKNHLLIEINNLLAKI